MTVQGQSRLHHSPPKPAARSRLIIGDFGPSDSALAAARGWRLRRPAADRHAARCASRDLCSGGAPRRYPPSVVHYKAQGQSHTLVVDEILVGAGRAPNIEGVGLDLVGVAAEAKKGIVVNERLQTTNPRIYAAGDVCMEYKFTHAADIAARTVIQNALFFGRKKLVTRTIPWCTYTDPEIAHVGLSERDAQQQGIATQTFQIPFREVDRALADGEEEGFVKIHVQKGSDRILGAIIVARHAGEMINEITLAMTQNIGLGALASVVHPYPTQAEAIRKAADTYNRTRLTPFVKKLFTKWLAWTR